MKEDVFKLVEEAVAANKYDKTEDVLRSGDEFCFLGMVCDLYKQHAPGGCDSAWRFRGESYDFVIRQNDGSWRGNNCAPPREVLDWVGMGSQLSQDVAEMNDDGLDFSDILNYLRKEVTPSAQRALEGGIVHGAKEEEENDA